MLRQKVCFVVGAAGAIGKAISDEFLAQGAIVIGADILFKKNDSFHIKQNFNMIQKKLNISSKQDIENLVNEIFGFYNRIDVVVNAAGILRSKAFELLEEDEWRQTIDINLTGTFLVCRYVFAKMKEQGNGVIINISSDAGEIGSTMSSADYSASKAGVLGLTKSIAREGAKYGIRANAVAPGFIDTEMLGKFKERYGTDELEAIVRDNIPLQRMGQPREVARLVSYLASDDASYITGATFDINGGSCML